ncbi:MAG: uracil-xanthine permease [Clostridia bacterium]|nr:uracil-xanthine permease [Clostridia bacterium]
MKLVYQPQDKPKFGQMIVFALQQVLAILAATIAVPMIISGTYDVGEVAMSPAAALFGAGVGTLVYVLFTKGRSPVFLGSSFAFLGSMAAAFGGALSVAGGFLGIIIGAAMAALAYVVIAIIVKFAGAQWVNKLMPAQVIGPTVSIIGLSLAGNAVGDLQTADAGGNVYIAIICGLVTLAVVCLCSVFGKKMGKLIPFIIGIAAGYALAAIFTVIGNAANIDALKVIDFSIFSGMSIFAVPEFSFLKAIKGFADINGTYILSLAAAYVPVALVVFAEHIADHKNISSIIEKDLLEDPGLHRTLLGDGVGSFAGAIFGGCPNTTYGESIACVAITGNASVATIICTAIICILISFFGPFVTLLDSIPACVMGGVCIALYGFIAVSGLKMVQKVDLEDNRNLFVVSTILICGIGGLSLHFGAITVTEIATALILGILVNIMLHAGSKKA